MAAQFSALPTELVCAVFDELCTDDAICLALVAQRFWDIGWPYVEKQLMGSMAPWAGHRLVCLGEDSHNVPRGMLNDDEERELTQGLTPRELALTKSLAVSQVLACDDMNQDYVDHLMDYSTNARTDDPVDLYRFAYLRYAETKAHEIPSHRAVCVLQHIAQHESSKMPRSVLSKITRLTNGHLPIFFPDDRKWVLRNLTTHEFVRSEVLAGNSEQNGPYFEDIGFEHIVLSRMLWSSESRSAIEYDSTVDDGIWAGHRLEITTLDDHTQSISSDVPWKDISEDAVKEIIKLCRAAEWISDAQSK